MARIPQISSKDEIPSDKGHIFDSISSSRGRISGPFSVLMHSPEVAGRAAHLGAYIRFESTLSDSDRELAIATTAREMDCDYEWSAHARLAREVGVRPEAIEVVANKGELDSLTEDEALIVRYGREILGNHKVSDATFKAAKEKFGVQGVTELTATFGYYSMLAAALNAFEVEPAPDAPRLPKV
jgi:4-carboxymuconolactone decarboxylase